MGFMKPYSYVFYIINNKGFIPLVAGEADNFIASWKEANKGFLTVNLSHGKTWERLLLIAKDGGSCIFPYGYSIGEILPKINVALKKAA